MIKYVKNNLLRTFCILIISIILWSSYLKSPILMKNGPSLQKLDSKFLKLDNSENEQTIWDKAEEQTNVALNYYNEWKNYSKCDEWDEEGIDVCDTSLPSIEEIDFNNIFWQKIQNIYKTQYFLYNAYYDNRGDPKNVRVVGSRKYEGKNVWLVSKK